MTLVELREKGQVKVRELPLTPLRDMRRIRGTYLQVSALPFYRGANREDYVQVTLTDEEDVPDGMQKLRVIYPNLMRLEYDNKRTRENGDLSGGAQVGRKDSLELFAEFYELQNNQPMSTQQQAFVEKMIQGIQEARDR